MANELNVRYNGTANIYAIIRRKSDAYVWNGSAFAAWADGSIADYDIALTSQGGDLYSTSFPSGITSGAYFVDYYIRAGATPATTDVRVSGSIFNWSGSDVTVGKEEPTAAEMVLKIKQALRDSPAGITLVNTDGQSVQYSRTQALEELKYWERRKANEAGTRPRAASINLSGF